MKTPTTVAEGIGLILGILTVGLLALAFQAWLLGLVLSWFSVSLSFWKCAVIIILLDCIVSAGRSSK